MAWEHRGSTQKYYYRSRKKQGRIIRQYYGKGILAEQAALEDEQKRERRQRERTERQHIAALQAQTTTLSHTTTTLVSAYLLLAGYHQHKRTWRLKRQIIQTTYGGSLMTLPAIQPETFSLAELETLVCSAIKGDRETLPAIRVLLNQTPALQDTFCLSARVKDAWLDAITGNDILSREVLEREAEALRASLTTDTASPLERLLIENIVVHWLALQNALRRAGEQVNRYGTTGLTTTHENHWSGCEKRFLASVTTLARIRALLQSKQKVQVNIANQQVNVA